MLKFLAIIQTAYDDIHAKNRKLEALFQKIITIETVNPYNSQTNLIVNK